MFEYEHLPMAQVNLKQMGRDGWELVSVHDGIMFFKRPVQEEEQPEKAVSRSRKAAVDNAC